MQLVVRNHADKNVSFLLGTLSSCDFGIKGFWLGCPATSWLQASFSCSAGLAPLPQLSAPCASLLHLCVYWKRMTFPGWEACASLLQSRVQVALCSLLRASAKIIFCFEQGKIQDVKVIINLMNMFSKNNLEHTAFVFWSIFSWYIMHIHMARISSVQSWGGN